MGIIIPAESTTTTKEDEAKNVYPNVYDNLSGEERRLVNVAKLIRKDIKDAIKRGLLPDGKYGVVKRNHSAIDIEVRAISTLVFNPEWLDDKDSRFKSRYNEVASAALAVLRVIHDRYNFDKSDIMTDYFHVHYYGSVQVDYDVENNELKLHDIGRYADAKPTFEPKPKTKAERKAFEEANPDVVEASGEVAEVVHNPRKNGVEVRFKSKPSDAARTFLKANGFRFSKRQTMWYARFTPALLADVKNRLGGSAADVLTPPSIQVGSGF